MLLGGWSSIASFTFGNTPHADPRARTPIRTNRDGAVAKTHAIGRARLTLRTEIINLFDDPAFAGARIAYGSAGFGTIPFLVGFPRTLQLQARVAW